MKGARQTLFGEWWKMMLSKRVGFVLLLSGAAFAQATTSKDRFDTAEVRASSSSGFERPAMTGGVLRGPRYDIGNATMLDLIQTAFSIDDASKIVGGPNWLNIDRFNIAATTSPLAAPETTKMMLQALLVDRFKLAAHTETRALPEYVMTAGNPKLKKADPSTRTGCKEGPGADGKDPRIAHPILTRLLTCRNMTITQFAEQLPQFVAGYVHAPVLDSTGLTDAYDFTLSFSDIGSLRSSTICGRNTCSSEGLSLPAAMNKQLGLKLKLQKRPIQVLAIDHVETPVDN